MLKKRFRRLQRSWIRLTAEDSPPQPKSNEHLHWSDDYLHPQFPLPRFLGVFALGHASAHSMARVGCRGLLGGTAREQTDAARCRCSVVSLVSRDGSRVL